MSQSSLSSFWSSGPVQAAITGSGVLLAALVGTLVLLIAFRLLLPRMRRRRRMVMMLLPVLLMMLPALWVLWYGMPGESRVIGFGSLIDEDGNIQATNRYEYGLTGWLEVSEHRSGPAGKPVVSRHFSIARGSLWATAVPSIVAVILAGLLWRRLSRIRERPGRCPQCGYLTIGLTGGVCPECGEPVASVTPVARGSGPTHGPLADRSPSDA
jgi:hypothetical protein